MRNYTVDMQVDVSRQAKVREWFKERIEGAESVHLPKLAADCYDEFARDQGFVMGTFGELFPQLAYEIGRSVLRQTRTDWIPLGDENVSRNEFKRRSGILAKKFTRWMEHSGNDGHVNLMHMRRRQLVVSAAEREARAQRELDVSRFLRRIASQLNGEEVVADRFSSQDLENLWEQLMTKEVA